MLKCQMKKKYPFRGDYSVIRFAYPPKAHNANRKQLEGGGRYEKQF